MCKLRGLDWVARNADLKHLVVDISGHGYGHAGITVPILNALRRHLPALQLTIRTAVPRHWLADRLQGPFDYVEQSDFGMSMAGPMRVLPAESLKVYSQIHADWLGTLSNATEQLAALKPNLLLSNVTYIPLLAARRLAIPAIAFGPLNWADIFRSYCIHLQGAQQIWKQMVEAYAAANVFLQTTPFMSMPSIRNGRAVGPVARIGRERKIELRRRLGLSDDILLILFELGGIPTRISFSNWPQLDRIRVLVGGGQELSHPSVIPNPSLEFPFIDLVRSCDVIITKLGYGLNAEAVCNGTPLVILPREDWPETPAILDWLKRYGRFVPLTEKKLREGDFQREVREACGMQPPPMVAPSGVGEIVRIVVASFGE